MNKYKHILIVVATLVIIFIVIVNYVPHLIEKKAINDYNIIVENFNELSIDNLNEKIKKGDSTFLLYTGRATCPWCRTLVKFLNEIQFELTIPIIYLDSENTQTDMAIKLFREDHNIEYVPSLIIYTEDQYETIQFDITDISFDTSVLQSLMAVYLE